VGVKQIGVQGDGLLQGREGGLEVALKEAPDLALVDIGLPGIDGFEVARRIRSDRRGDSIHLVALTGYGSREHRQQAEEAGFDGFLIKPGEPATLRAMLDGPLRGDDE
jgi:CheY-like chemotaxis protein